MARSRTELGAIAQHDVLTGLRNRHGLEVTLSAALDRYRQQEIPVSILIVDIDHFKKINDDFGHETGDKVLCEFSELLRRSIRSGDQLFRYGGEEFLIVANGTALEPAGRFAEKLRQKVRRYPVSHIGYMSASIGVADARRDDSPDSWFRRADERLYQAKQAGRNRVVTGPE